MAKSPLIQIEEPRGVTPGLLVYPSQRPSDASPSP